MSASARRWGNTTSSSSWTTTRGSCSSRPGATTRRWGAGPLRRAIQRLLEDPLADFILGRELAPGTDAHRRPPRESRRGRAAGRDPRHRGFARSGCRRRPVERGRPRRARRARRRAVGRLAPSTSVMRSRPTTGGSSGASTSGGAGAIWRRCFRSSSSSTSRGRASSRRPRTASCSVSSAASSRRQPTTRPTSTWSALRRRIAAKGLGRKLYERFFDEVRRTGAASFAA